MSNVKGERRVLSAENHKKFLAIVFGAARKGTSRAAALVELKNAGLGDFDKEDVSAKMTAERNRMLKAITEVRDTMPEGSDRRKLFCEKAFKKLDEDCPMFTRGRVAGTSNAELVNAFSDLLADIDAEIIDAEQSAETSAE